MRRIALKWLHWGSFFLIAYFFFAEPEDVDRLGAAALATHAGVGILLALVVASWTVMYLRKGLAGRPGPKLPATAKQFHSLGHKAMHVALPVMVLTGALAGFAAPYVIKAFGVLPINGGWGARGIHGFFEEIHEISFNIMLGAIIVHATFHLWRHFMLKDNALRIMTPKALHKYL
ncbi:cytochrome b [Loktanella sp. Alg231-35]|uniref:cytochrome b n=1 Tax=Loktanella sp. Alg231-35 TaxID=1922220 RepID=UPI001F428354|nr:cytochrome b/b6 domain-containing protein [Loktanella sp. Alg231-35]